MENIKLSKTEWDQAEFILDLLLPFKACSDRLEQTTRPGIDKVFWVYESLFNELDHLTDILEDQRNAQHRWMTVIQPALIELRDKLQDYYSKTERPSVYLSSVILQPRGKLSLFAQQSWDADDIKKNSDSCRERYIAEYEHLELPPMVSPVIGQKRKHSAIAEEDEDDEYEQMFQRLAPQTTLNEYDRYIQSPRVAYKVQTLDWLRQSSKDLPRLCRMGRDVLAVPATGAGVEREFSSSGQVVTAGRSRLSAATISSIMLYKNHLIRERRELKYWKGAGMRSGEDVEEPLTSQDEVPKEWRDQWWLDRKRKA
jgi:hypothetical protein